MVSYPKKNIEYKGSFVYPESDFALAAACGQIDCISTIGKFGSNTTVGTSSEIIWSGADVTDSNPFPSSHAKVRVRSGGDGADVLGGTGGNSIEIQGLDENWDIVSESIDLAGASASSESSHSYYRVVRAKVSSGSGGVNVDDIVIEQVGGECIAHVLAGNGQTTQAFFTIPRDHKGFMISMEAHTDNRRPAKIEVWRRVDVDTSTPSLRIVREFFGVSGEVEGNYKIPIAFDAYTDIYMLAIGDSADTEVSGMFDLYLVRD